MDEDAEPAGEDLGEIDAFMQAMLEDMVARGLTEDSDEATIKALVAESLETVTDAAAAEWSDATQPLHAASRRYAKGFSRRLHDLWGQAFTSLDFFVSLCLRAGAEANRKHRPAAAAEQDFVFEAVVRLHARGCQVAQEVLALLVAGLATGAMARWRTLHEITVTAMFIRDKGRDTAERYLLHDAVTRYRSVRDYQSFAARLGYEPFTTEEEDEIKGVRDALVARFGRPYGEEYGWAAEAIGNPKPNFREIEDASGLEHWRPYYRMASTGVHAASHGIMWSLGGGSTTHLPAGPSNAGLEDPGASTAISLGILTIEALAVRGLRDHESLIAMKAVLAATEVVDGSFAAAGAELERRIEQYPDAVVPDLLAPAPSRFGWLRRLLRLDR